MTNSKTNKVTTTAMLPRRGFFGAVAAAVAGTVGLGRLFAPAGSAPTATHPDERPVVTVHPNAVARTEEGSRRHG